MQRLLSKNALDLEDSKRPEVKFLHKTWRYVFCRTSDRISMYFSFSIPKIKDNSWAYSSSKHEYSPSLIQFSRNTLKILLYSILNFFFFNIVNFICFEPVIN